MRARHYLTASHPARAVGRCWCGGPRGDAAVCAVAAVLLFALLTLFSAPARAAECINESVRIEQGSAARALPECRAYELVTPGSKPFIQSGNEVEGARASSTGSGLAYYTPYPATDASHSGWRYLATRDGGRWSADLAVPQESGQTAKSAMCYQGLDFSEDLSRSILSEGLDIQEPGVSTDTSGVCAEPDEPLVSGAPNGVANLYLRDGLVGPYQLINPTPDSGSAANAFLRDYNSDQTHIIFEEAARLTDNSSAGSNIYEWADGKLYLITILPNGEPVAGKLANDGSRAGKAESSRYSFASISNAMSADGEQVYFTANGNLYLRRNATQPPTAGGGCTPTEPDNACTIQIDRKQGGSGESGGGIFQYASEDGMRVFFTAESKLTAGAQATLNKPDLFEYDVATGFLRDRTSTGTFESPDVLGFSGGGEDNDGPRLYFVANGVLAGSGQTSAGDAAQPFGPNLYALHSGEVSFVATLDREFDANDWYKFPGGLATATSSNGRFVLFPSIAPLTGFDSGTCPSGSEQPPCEELFLFDASSEQLSCVSCDPEGAVPTGNTKTAPLQKFSERDGSPVYITRQVLDDGRVFFTTPNKLLPGDVNGMPDVYEYLDGEHELISSGTAVGASVFLDASASGADVFFATPEALIGADEDNGISIYDARMEGGFPEPTAPPPPCDGESCRGASSAPASEISLGSLGFIGPQEGPKHLRHGNCRKGSVKRHGKCRKKVSRKARGHHRQADSRKSRRAAATPTRKDAK